MKYLWIAIAAWVMSMVFNLDGLDMDLEYQPSKEMYYMSRESDRGYRPWDNERWDGGNSELYARRRDSRGRYSRY